MRGGAYLGGGRAAGGAASCDDHGGPPLVQLLCGCQPDARAAARDDTDLGGDGDAGRGLTCCIVAGARWRCMHGWQRRTFPCRGAASTRGRWPISRRCKLMRRFSKVSTAPTATAWNTGSMAAPLRAAACAGAAERGAWHAMHVQISSRPMMPAYAASRQAGHAAGRPDAASFSSVVPATTGKPSKRRSSPRQVNTSTEARAPLRGSHRCNRCWAPSQWAIGPCKATSPTPPSPSVSLTLLRCAPRPGFDE